MATRQNESYGHSSNPHHLKKLFAAGPVVSHKRPQSGCPSRAGNSRAALRRLRALGAVSYAQAANSPT